MIEGKQNEREVETTASERRNQLAFDISRLIREYEEAYPVVVKEIIVVPAGWGDDGKGGGPRITSPKCVHLKVELR